MEIVNDLYTMQIPGTDHPDHNPVRLAVREAVRTLILLLNPFAPHVCEELWHILGGNSILALEPWPEWNENIAMEKMIEIPVQVNGKVRTRITVGADTAEEELEMLIRNNDAVQAWIGGKTVLKIIVVRNRLINVVVQ